MAKGDSKRARETNKLLESSKKLSDNLGMSLDDVADIQQKILDGTIKTEAALIKSLNVIKQQVKAKETLKKLDTDVLNLAKDLLKPFTQLGKLRRLDEKTGKMAYKSQVDSLKAKMKEVVAARKSGEINAFAAKQQMQLLVSMKKNITNLAMIEKKSPALAYGLQVAAQEAEGLQSKVDSIFSAIPGGDFIKNKLGLDKIGDQVQNSLVTGMGNVAKAIASGESPLAAMKAGFSAFNKVIMRNPVLLVVAAIVAAGLAIKKLIGLASEHEKKARETAEAMGISVSAGKEMVNNAYAAASGVGVQLVNAKEVLSVQKELSESLGNSSMISAEVAAQVADTGKSFGYGVKAAGQLQATLQGVGMESAAAAEMQRELAAEATKAGLDTGKIVQDIAQNAKSTAKFFGGNVKALKKAAIEANKLGMSISDMAAISDKLLDFENSISSQFELQAMTGKQINFDKARQLALEGDIAGATKEVLSQVGDINDFNNMSVLQRKKLADATGMEVDQLQKSLAIQSAMPNATAQQLKLLEKTGLSAEKIQNMSAEQLQNELARQQSSEKFAKGMENMKAQMSKALIPLGEAFMELFAALSPILKVIGFLFKRIGSILKFVGKVINAVFIRPLERAEDMISGIMNIFSGDFGKGFQQLAKGLIGLLTYPIQVIADIGVALLNSILEGVNLIPGVEIGLLPNFNIAGAVTGLATGGTVTKSGAFMVGEEGPEMVNLNAGSAVTPNNQLSGGDGVVKALETTNALLRELISAGTVVEMDGRVVAQAIRTTDSYRRR